MITRDTVLKRLQARRHERDFYQEQIQKTSQDDPMYTKMVDMGQRLDQDIVILRQVLVLWEEGRSEEARVLLKKVP